MIRLSFTFEISTQIPDYLALDKLASSVETILIVGGGFLGSELAAGLAHRGNALTFIVFLCMCWNRI